MSSSIHYKFKSSLSYDTITFDGLAISNLELKERIISQKKLGRSLEFDLLLTNAQTKEGKNFMHHKLDSNTLIFILKYPRHCQLELAFKTIVVLLPHFKINTLPFSPICDYTTVV